MVSVRGNKGFRVSSHDSFFFFEDAIYLRKAAVLYIYCKHVALEQMLCHCSDLPQTLYVVKKSK